MLQIFPGAALEARRLGGQRADRAEIDHVARQLRGHGFGDVGADLHMFAAPGRAQFAQAGDFLAETHAAGAVNAARHIGGDQRPDVLVPNHPLALVEARDIAAVAQRQILQLAFATLIADRAIQRMVDQQELHGAFLGGERLGRFGVRTFMPSITGVAQAGKGLGAFSTSTRHIRQLAAMDSFL
jgi:hypothetical protein